MIAIHLRGRVRAGRWHDLVDFLHDAIPFYEAPGDLRIRLLRDRADPDAFVEVVEYGSRAAYEEDQRRVASDPTMLAYLARWRDLLAGPVEVETYDDVTVETAQPAQ